MTKIDVHHGDCIDVLRAMDEACVDSVVTDPPYHLTSIVKRFGGENAAPAQFGTDRAYARASRGFMGKTWDGGDIAFRHETWAEVARVMKPGAHLVSFGGTRTQHRMICAIEDAGFEIRDVIFWVHSQGFPKSRDIGKAIDIEAGAVGASGRRFNTVGQDNGGLNARRDLRSDHPNYVPYAAATPEAAQWDGWGTALKPAVEVICLARKPLSAGTVAANVLEYGVGAINVDSCRVATDENLNGGGYTARACGNGWAEAGGMNKAGAMAHRPFEQPAGRWPANVMHDGSPEVLAAFAAFGEKTSGAKRAGQPAGRDMRAGGEDHNRIGGRPVQPRDIPASTGTAARFFPALGYAEDELRFHYCAKASKADRAGSRHPTVKPVKLIRWLARLITPPGGTILDPFSGSGTLAAAATAEGFNAILIEREAEYHDDIVNRIAALQPSLV